MALVLVVLLIGYSQALAQVQQVHPLNPDVARIGFEVQHGGLLSSSGGFGAFDGTITIDPSQPHQAQIYVEIDTTSAWMDDRQVDQILQGGDFFDSKTFPIMSFDGKVVEKLGPNMVKLEGDLTLKGVTKTVHFEATLEKFLPGAGQDKTALFRARGAINRRDFGVNAGAFLVDDVVEISIEAELSTADFVWD